jgi:hypothetical protein
MTAEDGYVSRRGGTGSEGDKYYRKDEMTETKKPGTASELSCQRANVAVICLLLTI